MGVKQSPPELKEALPTNAAMKLGRSSGRLARRRCGSNGGRARRATPKVNPTNASFIKGIEEFNKASRDIALENKYSVCC